MKVVINRYVWDHGVLDDESDQGILGLMQRMTPMDITDLIVKVNNDPGMNNQVREAVLIEFFKKLDIELSFIGMRSK